MTKLKLDIDGLTEDFFADARLLGITSTVKNYRFCWLLNNTLGYNFRLNSDIEIMLQKKGRQYFFPVYQYSDHKNYHDHFIYNNQFDGEYLLQEFKHMDFLWMIKSDCLDDEQCRQMMQPVKRISGVQLIAEITNEKIKNKGNLIF